MKNNDYDGIETDPLRIVEAQRELDERLSRYTPDMPVIKGPVELSHELLEGSFRWRLFDAESTFIGEIDTEEQAREIVTALNRQHEYDSERREMVRVMELAETTLRGQPCTCRAHLDWPGVTVECERCKAITQLCAAIERGKK